MLNEYFRGVIIDKKATNIPFNIPNLTPYIGSSLLRNLNIFLEYKKEKRKAQSLILYELLCKYLSNC